MNAGGRTARRVQSTAGCGDVMFLRFGRGKRAGARMTNWEEPAPTIQKGGPISGTAGGHHFQGRPYANVPPINLERRPMEWHEVRDKCTYSLMRDMRRLPDWYKYPTQSVHRSMTKGNKIGNCTCVPISPPCPSSCYRPSLHRNVYWFCNHLASLSIPLILSLMRPPPVPVGTTHRCQRLLVQSNRPQ